MTQQAFGSQLAALRKGQGLTQETLAQRLGVTNQAVSKWEQGLCYPDITLLAPLADLLRTSADALLGHEPPENTPDAVARALRRLLAATDAEALFPLCVQLAGILHEGIATLGYTRAVPWQPREGLAPLAWDFSAITEAGGATVRRGQTVLVSAQGDGPLSSAVLHSLRSILQSLTTPGALAVLFALSDRAVHAEEALCEACHLDAPSLATALAVLPIERTPEGVRLADCWQSVPQALRVLTV